MKPTLTSKQFYYYVKDKLKFSTKEAIKAVLLSWYYDIKQLIK